MSSSELYLDIELTRADYRLKLKETIPADGITAIFGESGAGKTTLLRVIAGFETPDAGAVHFNDSIFYNQADRINQPPHKRPIGFLFQDGRLFPHMTVDENLAFAEKRKLSEKACLSRSDIVSGCEIEAFLHRKPDTLSGGERQRAALARTLLTQPDLLLLDEPLAALDRQRKLELVPILEELPKKLGIPTLYVSHDIDEVSRVADRVLVLKNGSAVSFGSTTETLSALGFEAGRNPYEAGSILKAKIECHDEKFGLTKLRIGKNTLYLPIHKQLSPLTPVEIKISPKDVAIATTRPEQSSIQNVLEGIITSIEGQDGATFCTVTIDVVGQPIRTRITRKSAHELRLEPQDQVFALLKSASFYR